MTPTNIFGIALIAMGFGLAVAASIRVEKEKPESAGQRLGQWLFVWLVPFIGPLVTMQLLRREPEHRAGEYPVEHPFPDSAWSEPQPHVPSTDVDHNDN